MYVCICIYTYIHMYMYHETHMSVYTYSGGPRLLLLFCTAVVLVVENGQPCHCWPQAACCIIDCILLAYLSLHLAQHGQGSGTIGAGPHCPVWASTPYIPGDLTHHVVVGVCHVGCFRSRGVASSRVPCVPDALVLHHGLDRPRHLGDLDVHLDDLLVGVLRDLI